MKRLPGKWPQPIGNALAQIKRSHEAKARIEPDRPLERPKREPGEPFGIFVDYKAGFRLSQQGDERIFEFLKPPPGWMVERMESAGFVHDEKRKCWAVLSTPRTREESDKLALLFSPKDFGRGR